MSAHLSDSSAHRKAERVVRERLAAKLGKPLDKMRVALDGVAFVEVDAVDPAESVFAEIFSRVGKLNPGQEKKVVTDAFKLVTLARTRPGADLFLVFVDEQAAAYATGERWLARALALWGIGVEIVEIEDDLRQELLSRQAANARGFQTPSGDTLTG